MISAPAIRRWRSSNGFPSTCSRLTRGLFATFRKARTTWPSARPSSPWATAWTCGCWPRGLRRPSSWPFCRNAAVIPTRATCAAAPFRPMRSPRCCAKAAQGGEAAKARRHGFSLYRHTQAAFITTWLTFLPQCLCWGRWRWAVGPQGAAAALAQRRVCGGRQGLAARCACTPAATQLCTVVLGRCGRGGHPGVGVFSFDSIPRFT